MVLVVSLTPGAQALATSHEEIWGTHHHLRSHSYCWILAFSAWWWIESEIDSTFIQEIDVALVALGELRTGGGSTAAEDPEVLRAIEEHEMTLDVFAITLSELRGDSSDEAKAALARIRDYRQKHPRTSSKPEYDARVQQALGLKQR